MQPQGSKFLPGCNTTHRIGSKYSNIKGFGSTHFTINGVGTLRHHTWVVGLSGLSDGGYRILELQLPGAQ